MRCLLMRQIPKFKVWRCKRKHPHRSTIHLSSKYCRYSKEELVKIIEDRDRKPTFGLVWERDDIESG
jgi:hypothetical protein